MEAAFFRNSENTSKSVAFTQHLVLLLKQEIREKAGTASMKNNLISPKEFTINIDNDSDHERIVKLCYALSVRERVEIMKTLLESSQSLSDLSKKLNIPPSSMVRHLNALIEGGFVQQSFQPGPKGHTKYYAPTVRAFTILLKKTQKDESVKYEYVVEMPIGMFSHCHIKAPCGMLGAEGNIGLCDNPNHFFSPERMKAECIWFDSGFISYNFPTDFSRKQTLSEITFSLEICSETIYYNNHWPSDITVCINNKEVTTFTSPGDFGGRRGKYTPLYWPLTNTQFGLLEKITVNNDGVFMNNIFVSDKVRFDDLHICDGSSIKLDIGVKDDAKHKGGINLFGKNFGDYPQAIIMTLK